MTTVLPEGNLRALIHLAAPEVPETLLSLLVSRKQLDSEETLHVCEAELYTRLFLYDLILKKDTSMLSELVVAEIRENCFSCLALLLNVQWRLKTARGIASTVQRLVSDEIALMASESREFVAKQVVNLLLDNPDIALLSAVEDAAGELQLPEEFARILELAQVIGEFQPHHPPGTIAPLRELAAKDGEAGVAARYLLARIYHETSLPYEEKECYSSWVMGIAQTYKRTASDLAGWVSRENPAMEKVIIDGAIRWLQLLRASGAHTEVNQKVDEFNKAGYKGLFEPLRVDQARLSGYQCRLLTRDEVSDEAEMKAVISEILTSGVKQGACLVVRDEPGADAEKFPLAPSASPEGEILIRLPDHVASAGLMILPEIVEESVLQRRKWVVCVDQTRPMDALAVGILPMENEFSVVYARAVVFDTKLDPAKDQGWFQSTIRLLGQGFDAQKTGVIRDKVRRVADQISTGRSTVQVLES